MVPVPSEIAGMPTQQAIGLALVLTGCIVALVALWLRPPAPPPVQTVMGRKPRACLILATRRKRIHARFLDRPATLEAFLAAHGYAAWYVSTVREAVEAAAGQPYDAIMVDWGVRGQRRAALRWLMRERVPGDGRPLVVYNVARHDGVDSARIAGLHLLGTNFADSDLRSIFAGEVPAGGAARPVRLSFTGHALSGDVAHTALDEVLLAAEQSGRRGRLVVERKGFRALLFLDTGRVVYAACGSTTGREAVTSILNLREGHFRFTADRRPRRRNCDAPVREVVMEWARQRDELAVSRTTAGG